jgi:hypothetical protein
MRRRVAGALNVSPATGDTMATNLVADCEGWRVTGPAVAASRPANASTTGRLPIVAATGSIRNQSPGRIAATSLLMCACLDIDRSPVLKPD